MLDSEHKIANSEDAKRDPVEASVNLAPFKGITSGLFESNIEICTQFRDFLFTGWDKNAKEWLLNESKRNDENHRFDQDASLLEPENVGGMASDASDFGGDLDDDHNFPDNFGEEPLLTDGEARFASENASENRFSQKPFADSLRLELFLEPSEYSYFRQDILDTWAGPHHWKLKSNLKGPSKSNQNDGEGVKKKREKKVFTYNYDDDSVIEGIRKPGKKTAKTLSAATLKKMSVLQTTLPEDIHYDVENFPKLFLKPSMKVRRLPQSSEEVEEADICSYNYESRCDTDNFCPALQDGDDDYNDSDNVTHTMLDYTAGDQTVVFGGDNLVVQPNRVEKINIGYAKTAKKIDIKKLKRTMWETLNSSKTQKDKENIPENINDVFDGQEKQNGLDSPEEPQSFKDMYSILPSKLSQSASKNLSVPIAFVCLLYLANEKGLHLTGSDDMSDFNIVQDSFESKLDS